MSQSVTVKRDANANSGLGRIAAFVDGARLSDNGLETFENVNPADGSVNGLVEAADEGVVDAAVAAARRAVRGEPWATTDDMSRAEMLERIADEIERRFDDFLAAEIADTGKPMTMASHIDIPRTIWNFRFFASVVRSAETESTQMNAPGGLRSINYGVRQPKGVIAVVCPWNLPLFLMTWKVAPALACGNSVIVKPSELTPSTAMLLGEVMKTVGVPDGVYNVVNGFGPGAAGEFLTTHPGVDAITFTGETKTGEAIMRAAAAGVRDVSFELGGKNPGVIFADCDFDAAVHTSMRSVFTNSGQICLSTERLYVERPIFDRFVEALQAKAEAFRPGDPMDKATTIGPMISDEHRRKVLSYYDAAASDGATVVAGGGEYDMPTPYDKGGWVQPTIWTGLAEASAAVREEIFGPCVHIAPFDDEDQAIAMANDTPYGLNSMVWTSNLSRAHRVADAIDCGTCWVNTFFLRDLRTPFGGSKRSGIGREGGVHSLDFYSELKNVCIQF